MFNPPPDAPHDGNETSAARAQTRPATVLPAMEPNMRAGTKLRTAREALGLSLEQVSAKTRIRVEYIAALETMNVNLIPGKAYAKAYLRSYVKFLGMTSEELIFQYENECARLREDAGDQIRNPNSKPAPERPWLAAAALAVVCAAFVGWRATHDGSTEAPPPPAQTRTERAEAAIPTAPVPSPTAEDPWGGLSTQVVEIRAIVPSWLEVRGPDGTIFVSRTIQAGETYRPDVGGNWTLHAKDGGAFEVLLNGTLLGPLGDAGSPVLGRQVDKIAAAPPAPVAPAGEG